MRPLPALLCIALGLPAAPSLVTATPIQVYGVWHAGNDACIWGTVRTLSEFDGKNHWIIDRGDGQPSVNLVILSFIQPEKLLNHTTDATTLNGVPRGMTQEVVNYFTSQGIRVMISIGGITYVTPWENALAANATQLGLNAAAVAGQLGVGIEIDYEGDSAAAIASLQTFIDAYRSVHPYDRTGADPAARLTIDLAAGDRWLIALCGKASKDWLDTAHPVLDYANAMVPSRQPSAGSATDSWQEHIDGNSRMSPPIVPVAPAKLTGSLWLSGRHGVTTECTSFTTSVHYQTRDWVQNVLPNGAGTTPGLLGYMFWAAECEGTQSTCTTPPNACLGGLGAGAQFFAIPIPMPPLRQDSPTSGAPVSSPPQFNLVNAPNPFQNGTEVRFSIPERSKVDLRVFDVQGQEVDRIVNAEFPAGMHEALWTAAGTGGRALSAGTYFIRIRAVTESGRIFEKTTRMTIVR